MSIASETLLDLFGLKQSDFFYSRDVCLYKSGERIPFGKITYTNGKYKLSFGGLDGVAAGVRHVVT